MPDKYTSKIALVLDGQVDVGEIVQGAVASGDIDRAHPVRGQPAEAQEVHWGGRMQKGVVRRLVDEGDRPMLRSETYIGSDGLTSGLQRQGLLLQALARQLSGRVQSARDLSARAERDLAWVHRLAIGAVEIEDGITLHHEGEGTYWVYTHGAARFDVPDLELYGLIKAQLPAADEVLRHVHEQLLRFGLRADLTLPDGQAVYLVPVLEAWSHVPFDWPGVGKAGQNRGDGLDGPRATLSLLHKPRFGRYRTDLEGVLEALR